MERPFLPDSSSLIDPVGPEDSGTLNTYLLSAYVHAVHSVSPGIVEDTLLTSLERLIGVRPENVEWGVRNLYIDLPDGVEIRVRCR